VDCRLNRRNKAAFLNFFGVVWTGPELLIKIIEFRRFSPV